MPEVSRLYEEILRSKPELAKRNKDNRKKKRPKKLPPTSHLEDAPF